MKGLVRLGDRLLEDTASAILLVLVVIALLQVASRYLFAVSLPWTEEAGRFLFTWVIWLGAAVALRRAQHMRFDILVQVLRPPVRAGLQVLADTLVLGFLALLVVQGWRVTESVALTTYIAMPWLSIKYAYGVTVVVGGLMVLIQTAALAADLAALFRGASPARSPARGGGRGAGDAG
jgi:TRAP-type C4-dicarboxylate transport system permease small subunit